MDDEVCIVLKATENVEGKFYPHNRLLLLRLDLNMKLELFRRMFRMNVPFLFGVL